MPVQFFTEGDDTDTVSTAGDYTLVFLGGSDKLTVTGGTTITAAMGEGDDLVSLKAGAPAATTVYGESGADRFDIWAAGIAAYGGGDSDLFNIRAGGGQSIFGESGNDRFNFYGDVTAVNVDGGDGNDDFYGYGHSIGGDVYGGAGNDYFVGFVGTGGATIHGGLGNDIFRVDPANAATFQENVGEGLDSVQVARGDSYVLPDNIENISVQGFSGSVLTSATLTGNESNNHIVTHNNSETINGLGGNDSISAKGGDDTVNGGEGNDYIDGGSGNDTLNGDAGNDTLQGRSGDDVMSGGTGNDTYYVDSASDQVIENPGEGIDLVRTSVSLTLQANVENAYVSGSVGLTIDGNELDNLLVGGGGDDYFYGHLGNDTLKGGAGNDFIGGNEGNDTVIGGDGNDQVFGDEGDDNVQGGNGDDWVQGYYGDDVLQGGDGNDTLGGHVGADTMTGGAGNDTFQYWTNDDSTSASYDTITDFSPNQAGTADIIDLTAIDADINTIGDQAFTWADLTPTANALWWSWTGNADGSFDIVFYGDTSGDTTADVEIHVHQIGYVTIGTDVLL